jgi:hypothetical protein
MNAAWDAQDSPLHEALAVFEPTPNQVARLMRLVEDRLERERHSLAWEWLDLLKQRPLAHASLMLVAAFALLATTPLGSLLWAVLQSAT